MPDKWQEVDELHALAQRLDLAAKAQQEELSFGVFFGGYLLLLGGAVGAAVLGRRLWGLDPFAVVFVVLGVIYLIAAAQRPMIVYLILRNVRWFASIRDTRLLRQIMLVFGLALLLAGIFAPFSRFFRIG